MPGFVRNSGSPLSQEVMLCATFFISTLRPGLEKGFEFGPAPNPFHATATNSAEKISDSHQHSSPGHSFSPALSARQMRS
eukprot:1964112-Rhodomonas_salina.1